jgi:hypothetical protein
MAVDTLHQAGQPPEVPSPATAGIDPDTVAFLRAAGCVYGGPDGTRTQTRVLTVAGAWLRDDGVVMIETAPRMATMTASIAESSGFAAEIRHSPELEATVVVATRAS